MRNSDYVVFDYETGGLKPDKNPILEVAYFLVDRQSFIIKDKLEFLIKPYDDLVIEKKALEVNGLKMTELENGLSKNPSPTLRWLPCGKLSPPPARKRWREQNNQRCR